MGGGGLVPTEPQYGDVGALRALGVKQSPDSQTPTFFNPAGGRPPGPRVNTNGQAPALGGPANGSPPASGIPAEHQSLFDRAFNLAQAARAWNAAARLPGASQRVKDKALQITEAAKLATFDARNGTPFHKDF